MGVVGLRAYVGLSFGKGTSLELCGNANFNAVTCQGKKFQLVNTHRPHEIGDWLQYGRRGWDKQPLIAATEIDRYSSDWWKWWAELQPSSRSAENPLLMPRKPPDDGNWPEVMKGTNNGFYMLLVALGWWAQSLQYAGLDMKAWVQATADVLWAVDQIKSVAEETRKRSWNEGGSGKETGDTTTSHLPSKRCMVTLSDYYFSKVC